MDTNERAGALPGDALCEQCGGSGLCSTCNGNGKYMLDGAWRECADCVSGVCSSCSGSGRMASTS